MRRHGILNSSAKHVIKGICTEKDGKTDSNNSVIDLKSKASSQIESNIERERERRERMRLRARLSEIASERVRLRERE